MKKFTLVALSALMLLLGSLTSNAQSAGALNFDGSNDYVNLGNPSSMQFSASGAFTVELWVNPLNTAGGWHSIIDKTLWGWGPTGTGVLLYIYNDVLYLVTPTWNTDYGILFSTPIDANTWTNVAFSYSNGTWNMYVNGDAVGAAVTGKYYTNSTAPWTIGMRTNNDGTGQTDPTSMNIDELRIWNRVLTNTEMDNNRYCELASGASGLVAYYRFNQGTAGASNTGITTVTDNSGNGNTGTLYNFGLTGSSSNWVAGYVTGSCSSDGKVTVCHKGQNISISASALAAHVAHGDYVGGCGGSKSSDESEHGIDEISVNTIKVYPNPTEGIFNVEIPATQKQAEIAITDITGRIIERKIISDNEGEKVMFNLENAASGMYMIRVAAGDEIYVSKLMVK